MSLPNYLAKIKSAGIYRFVWDKSVAPIQAADTLRLVVGYSEKGPFNTPVYIDNTADFKTIFGGISKRLEKKGIFFHRMALQALANGPILALNLKKFSNETVSYVDFDAMSTIQDISVGKADVTEVFNTNKFWSLDQKVLSNLSTNPKYITIAATDSKETSCTIFLRKYTPTGYDVTVKAWYASRGEELPSYFENNQDLLLQDTFAEIYVFRGEFTPTIAQTPELKKYFTVTEGKVSLATGLKNAFNEPIDTLQALAEDECSNFIQVYRGTLIPFFKDNTNTYISLDLVFNLDNSVHKMIMNLDSDLLEESDDILTCIKPTSSLDDAHVVKDDNAELVITLNKYNDDNQIESVESSGTIKYEYLKEMDEFLETNLESLNDEHKNIKNWLKIGFPYDDNYVDDENLIGIFNYLYMPIDTDGIILDHNYNGTYAYEYNDDSHRVVYTAVDIIFSNIDLNSMSAGFRISGGIINPDLYDVELTVNFSDSAEIDGNATTWGTFANTPIYLEGYTYGTLGKNLSKEVWQNKILSTLTDYKGLIEALTNNIDIEYHYIVDTFESFVGTGNSLKTELALIAKKKDNCLAILNFPFMSELVGDKTLMTNNTFDIKKIKNGKVTLPSTSDGASWCAFYTAITLSDGTVKTYCPSAAVVSNLFMDKYGTRQPYSIVAGPNYGLVTADGMVGPDYNFSRNELDFMEPFGVNCLVYVPRRGTQINSNQTAKQTPVSALSKVHVRELVIYLQDEIAAMLQSYQWEFNTQTLRDTIKAKVDKLLENVQQNGGVYAFKNVCDESNNTDDVINNEMLVLSTHIEPGMGAGKLVEELTIYRKGGMTSSAV